MDNKKIIIIAVLLLIVASVIIVMLTSLPNYERIELTQNGTTINVPINKTEFCGEFGGIKFWYWDNGVLVSYNTHEGDGVIKLMGLSFNTLNELVKKGEIVNLDDFTCYVINTDDLEINVGDIIKFNYTGEFYCIPLSNDTSQDNIIIFCSDKDRALDMARSVQYKNVHPENITMDEVISTVENITEN